MAYTIIKYNNQELAIAEIFVELLSHFFCETFEEIGLSNFNGILTDIYDDCNENRKGMSGQSVYILLEDITTSGDKNTMINVLQQTKIRILSLGVELSVRRLNEFENNKVKDIYKQIWTIPVKTQSLATSLEFIVDLLNGTFQYSNKLVQYTNYPNIDGEYIMV